MNRAVVSRRFQAALVLLLSFIALTFLAAWAFVTLFPAVYWRTSPKVALPNDYSFVRIDPAQYAIIDREGRTVVPPPLDTIQISKSLVYGRIPNQKEKHFAFNTEVGELISFSSYEEFSRFLRERGLPPVYSGESYTYWDFIEKNPRLNR